MQHRSQIKTSFLSRTRAASASQPFELQPGVCLFVCFSLKVCVAVLLLCAGKCASVCGPRRLQARLHLAAIKLRESVRPSAPRLRVLFQGRRDTNPERSMAPWPWQRHRRVRSVLVSHLSFVRPRYLHYAFVFISLVSCYDPPLKFWGSAGISCGSPELPI